LQENVFVETTKVTSKGQATIPKSVREILGINPGDRVSFVVRGNNIQIVGSDSLVPESGDRRICND
jgi:AbrB family looped-hinge helix DNA binding protein